MIVIFRHLDEALETVSVTVREVLDADAEPQRTGAPSQQVAGFVAQGTGPRLQQQDVHPWPRPTPQPVEQRLRPV